MFNLGRGVVDAEVNIRPDGEHAEDVVFRMVRTEKERLEQVIADQAEIIRALEAQLGVR